MLTTDLQKLLSAKAKALGPLVRIADLSVVDPVVREGYLSYSDYEGFKSLYFSDGATWIPILGADRFLTEVTYTVGASGSADFPTLYDAFFILQRFRPSFGAVLTNGGTELKRVDVILELESGEVVDEQLSFDSEDMGWVALRSVDAVVDVDVSSFLPRAPGLTHDAGTDVYPFIYVSNSSASPRVETHFRAINVTPGQHTRGLNIVNSAYEDWIHIDDNEPTPQNWGLSGFFINVVAFESNCRFYYKLFEDSEESNVVVNGGHMTLARSIVRNPGEGVSPIVTGHANITGLRNAHINLLGTTWQAIPGTNNDAGRGAADLIIVGNTQVYVKDLDLQVAPNTLWPAAGGTTYEPNTLQGFLQGAGYIAWDGYVYGGNNSGIDTDKTIAATSGNNVYTRDEIDTIISPATELTIKTETGTTYTLDASDDGKLILFTNGSNITITCDALTEGFQCVVRQRGAGVVSFTDGAGVTITPAYGQGLDTLGLGSYVNVIYETATEVGIKGDLVSV